MKIIFRESGISERALNRIITILGNSTTIRTDYVVKIISVISKMYDECHKAFFDVWNLLPPEYWANYKLMGFKNLREQDLLKEVTTKFRAKWTELINFRKELNGIHKKNAKAEKTTNKSKQNKPARTK
jgi:hypothetical protein